VAGTPQLAVVHLDTHVVCWLYAGRIDLLSEPARETLEAGRLFVSPLVDLELQLLREIGRLSTGPERILKALSREIDLQFTTTGLVQLASAARDLHWTRDPFDRLIVADALLAGAPLVTKDSFIRKHFAAAVW
jgi:PIN domain nuclease of toxin-antitoxin system